MVVTGKEIEQLKPWIKSTVRSMFGIEDPSFVIAATNCLERQLSKGDTQKALESLMAADSAVFTDKLFDEVSSLKAKKKAPAKAAAASPPAPAPELISPKRKRDETPEVAEKDSKKSRSDKEKDEKRHRDKHDRDHRDRDREKEKERDKDRDRDRDRTRDKDRREKDREKESDRDRKDKKRDERDDRDKEKERDRKERDREKERDRDREREREKERDRDRDRREREREREKEKTPASKVTNISAIKADLAKKLEEKRRAVANSKPVQPPPLILDSQGREVDSAGKVITTNISTTNIKTIKANKKYDLLESAPAPDVTKSKYYDARVAVPKVGRQRRDWSFVEHGTYIKKGDKLRTKAAEEEMKQRIAEAAGGEVKQEDEMRDDNDDEDINPNLIQLGVKEEPKIEDPIPSVEWWDESIMTIDEYPTDPALLENPVKILKHDLWQYIEHPPIQDNSGPPPVLPLMLTKKELQKLRRGRRLEVQKDKQERVLLGIDPPPPPKVRISNLMRVLTNEAVQDPTQIEMKVRSEMDQRQANHDARNEARKLSKEERWAKKKRKLLEDAAKEMHCALFKLKHLESQKIRSKLDHVAQDCLLSGSIVLAKDMVLVIVEGGIKSIRKYKKLMANRIRWNAEEEDEVNEEEGNKKENKCDLVWEGTIQRANFKHFVIETTVTDNMARRFLAEHNVPHFWDMAKNFKDPLEL